MKYEHLYIAVPNNGHLPIELIDFLLEMTTEGAYIDMNRACGVDHNRNIIAHQFLESPQTEILWVDSDVEPSEYYDFVLDSDLDIITGVTPVIRDTGKISSNIKALSEDDKVSSTEITEVLKCGLSFVKMKKKVIQDVVAHYGKMCQFEFDEKGSILRGEDFIFCDWARERGYKIHCDGRVLCRHFKTIDLSPLLISGGNI